MKLVKTWPLAVALLAAATGCTSPVPPRANPVVSADKPATTDATKAPAPNPPPPPAPQPAQVQISREQAIQIMQSDARSNIQVRNARLVEFVTRGKEPVMIAVWVLDLGDGTSPQGYAVIDATTGDVLNVTNAHSGQ